MTTTIYQSRIDKPAEESREWLRPLVAANLTRMTEMANHLLAYKSAMTIHHVWHYAHFDETTTTGTSGGTNTIRSMSSTGFFANPNLINPTEAAPGTVIDGGFIVEQIVLPHTSPFCGSLQLTLRFQAHRYNLDPSGTHSASLYSQMFNHPHRITASTETDQNILYSVGQLMEYVDRTESANYTHGIEQSMFVGSQLWSDAEIRFRLKDKDGNIIDPSGASGWAVRLAHNGQGLPQDQGFSRGITDEFPVCEVSLTIPSAEPSSSSLAPRALSYGSKANSGEKIILEIGYLYARPLSLTINEVPPMALATSNYVAPLLFPTDFPVNQPTANEGNANGVQAIYVYQGHVYLRVLMRHGTASNGVVFFPEPPTSSWPFSGMDLSTSGISGNSDFDLFGCSSSEFEYQGECYNDHVGGELDRIGPSTSAFSGTAVPGDNSRQNDWTTQPASNTEYENMGEMVLQNGGAVWHSSLNNWPDHAVICSSSTPYTITDSGRAPLNGNENVFLRVPISSITAWGGTLADGDAKCATAFTIFDSITTRQGEIFHAQMASGNGAAAFLEYFSGITGTTWWINTLENSTNLDEIKAEMDSMGVP